MAKIPFLIFLGAMGIFSSGLKMSFAASGPLEFSASRGAIETHVRFIKAVVTDPSVTGDVDDSPHNLVELTFYRDNQKVNTYLFKLYDAASPMTVENLQGLYQQFTWSPDENYVVLPSDVAAQAPGTLVTTALNLNPSKSWRAAAFSLDDVIFLDSYRAVGTQGWDCNWHPVLFDGRVGQSRDVIQPTNYGDAISIDAILSTKSKITFRKVSQCDPSHVDPAHCFEFDAATEKTSPIPCPKTY